MAKRSIAWHEECLQRWNQNLKYEKQQLQERLDELEHRTKQYNFYKQQIAEAKKQKKDGFDSE